MIEMQGWELDAHVDAKVQKAIESLLSNLKIKAYAGRNKGYIELTVRIEANDNIVDQTQVDFYVGY